MDAQVVFSNPDGNLTVAGAPYELLGVGVTGRVWRRTTVEGRYQHGRKLLGAVLDTPTLTVAVRLTGDTWVAVRNRRQSLETVLSQLGGYTATVTLAGQLDVYTCEPADVLTSDAVEDRWRVEACFQDVTLTIPIEPV